MLSVVVAVLLLALPQLGHSMAPQQPAAVVPWCHAEGDKLRQAQDWEAAAAAYEECSRASAANGAGAAAAWALYRAFEMYSYKLRMPAAALDACTRGWEAAPAAELAWCAAYQAFWMGQHEEAAEWAERAVAMGCFEGSCDSLEHLVHNRSVSGLKAAWEGAYEVLQYARQATGDTAGAQEAYRRKHQAGNARRAYNKDPASFHATKAATFIPMVPIVAQPDACGAQMLSDLHAGSRYRPRLHVVAFATDLESPRLVPLLTSAEAYGIQVTVLTTSHSFGGARGMWGIRLMLSTNFLNMLPEQDYVMFVDAYDVVFSANASAILAAFKEAAGGRDVVVYTVQDDCWPDSSLAAKFPEGPSRHKYINGGGAMGTVRALRCAMAAVGTALDDHRFAYSDDQGLFNHLFVSTVNTSRPLIVLDTGHRLIASLLDMTTMSEPAFNASDWVCVEGVGWTHTITGGTPKVFHAPASQALAFLYAEVLPRALLRAATGVEPTCDAFGGPRPYINLFPGPRDDG